MPDENEPLGLPEQLPTPEQEEVAPVVPVDPLDKQAKREELNVYRGASEELDELGATVTGQVLDAEQTKETPAETDANGKKEDEPKGLRERIMGMFSGGVFGSMGKTFEKFNKAKGTAKIAVLIDLMIGMFESVKDTISSMGSGTLSGLQKLAGMLGLDKAANFLGGLAGGAFAAMNEALKATGIYELTKPVTDEAKRQMKNARRVLENRYKEYKANAIKKHTPAVQPGTAPTATIDPPTMEDFMHWIVSEYVEKGPLSQKPKNKDGMREVTLMEIVEQLPPVFS